ncbi:MAG: copper chaperone PCu(A)C [Actinomycetota bacterium]
MNQLSSRTRLGAGLVALAAVGAACGSDSGGVEATGAWARPSAMMTDAAAVYMVLDADEETTIVSAAVSSDIAGRTELHETVAMDEMHEDGEHDHEDGEHEHEDGEHEDGEHEHGDDEAMGDVAMMMQELDGGITIPADGEVVLEPGGLHVMLLDLPAPLEEGETFDVTFTDDAGDEFTVEVEVRSEAP